MTSAYNDRTSHPDVALVVMPFTPVTHPSLALGCLAGALRQNGIRTRCRYFSLDFAKLLGPREHYIVSNYLIYDLLGDWVFSRAAFPEFDSDIYLDRFAIGVERDLLLRARSLAGDFIDAAAREVVDMQPRIVGVSSMFGQNCASLALLRRIRELAPGIVTVMGGANCEGEMGRAIHRNFPWVDFVFSGEADLVFPEFCRRILAGEQIGGAGNWSHNCIATPNDREAGSEEKIGRGSVEDLAVLPDPFFDDYFADLEQSGLDELIAPGILLETSRGCWWGERNPCSFCGLNGLSRKYRRKSPDAAYSQIIRLTARHGMTSVQMTDNIIGHEHIDRLIPRFKGKGMHFLYEATPTLSKEQLRELADAGVVWIQPGIEHLNDGALKALNKSNRAFHNVRFLKWAREFGITLFWNLMFFFPGEDDAWLGELADLVPLLVHLQPPMALPPLRYDRFSRYHETPEAFGVKLAPYPAYSDVYPLGQTELERLAYFFHDVSGADRRQGAYSSNLIGLLQRLREWMDLFPMAESGSGASRQKPMLGMRRTAPDSITIEDTRPIAGSPAWELIGLDAAVYDLCDAGLTLNALSLRLREDGYEEEDVAAAVDRLVSAGIMARLGGHYVSLAVHLPCRDFAPHSSRPGGYWKRRKPPIGELTPDTVTAEQVYGATVKKPQEEGK